MEYERKPVQPFGGGRERARTRRPRPADAPPAAQPPRPQSHSPQQGPLAQRTQPSRAAQQQEFRQDFEESPRKGRFWEFENDDGEESNSNAVGIAVFLLIFGVGNYFLYKYTGWLIIPIPRR